jgi:hypothetical protein
VTAHSLVKTPLAEATDDGEPLKNNSMNNSNHTTNDSDSSATAVCADNLETNDWFFSDGRSGGSEPKSKRINGDTGPSAATVGLRAGGANAKQTNKAASTRKKRPTNNSKRVEEK